MADKETRPPVVGIGASAGGVEALQRFFENVPADLGVAYVVVVHLAPDRESDLPGIIGRCTSMPVTQVGDHDQVDLLPDHVYVIAPGRKLEITDTSVGASRFEQPRGQRAAVDLFFRSLAAAHGDGYAVILSGSGSDGALGAKAVKEAGGVVLVQDPEEAAHDGMPRSVISTGVADVVLPIRELAGRLAALIRDQASIGRALRLTDGEPSIGEDDEADLRAVLELLRSRTGHDFTKYKRNTVLRRLARRMQLQHVESLDAYRDRLKDDDQEVQALFNDLLISVTSFFRDAESWEALREQVVGPLIEAVPADEQIRVWVPGCATGEEAYSMAMLFQEELQARRVARDYIIFASDVDEGALAVAREGRYPEAIAADVSEARLERFFRHEDDHYQIAGAIRDRVVFAVHSLLRDPPFSKLHLVSCRNLLIYLGQELQEQVMGVFRYACRDGAWLFLGVSETADSELFESVDKRHRIYRARPGKQGERLELPDLLAAPRGALRPGPAPHSTSRPPPDEVHAEALEALAPPSLVVDERGIVLHLSSSAGRYLQQRGGPLTRVATELVRPELQDEVGRMLHRAFQSGGPQLSSFVGVRFNGTPRRVAVLAQWRRAEQAGQSTALVTFLEAGDALPEEAPAGQSSGGDVVRELRERLRQAERRAEHMNDDQHLVNEDLRAANEELQSLNEEYRSTTEELETSKEELQSINEELQTVNHELKSKLEEVSRANADMENLMTATDIATLFLDRSLCIQRFTPQLTELFHLRPRDQGRPIGDFNHNLDYDGLERDARRVIEALVPVEREARSRDGRSFIVRFRPYRTDEDRIDGAVVTFIDVTELARATEVLRQSEERFRALVDASAQMVWTTDPEGLMVEDSASWRAFTGQTFEAWRGAGWLDAVHPDDRAVAESAWREAVASGGILDSEFRIYHAPSDTYRWTSMRAVPLEAPDGAIRGWVGMNIDVTERHEAVGELRRADEQKNEFLAVLGHELRNPLAAIRNTLTALHAAPAGSAELKARAWNVIDRQSRHMTRLVNDLLDVERIKRGRLNLSRQPVEICQCVRDAVEALRGQIDAAELSLDLDLPDHPVTVHADSERLVQMVDNLLRNSINYTARGGRITVSARQEGGHAVIDVSDTGIGIEPQEMAELFEPYYQGKHDGGSQGLGLGLTLVRRLAEMHDGSVDAYSEGRGAGSAFTLTLPVTEAGAESVAPAESPSGSLRVLVVDDQVDLADTFAGLLQSLGQQADIAYNGEDALEVARRQRPQVAFLDLAMPGMDGHELARRLREAFPPEQLALVAVTGYGSREEPAAEGVFDHRLLKPADVDSVIEVLRSVTGDDRF